MKSLQNSKFGHYSTDPILSASIHGEILNTTFLYLIFHHNFFIFFIVTMNMHNKRNLVMCPHFKGESKASLKKGVSKSGYPSNTFLKCIPVRFTIEIISKFHTAINLIFSSFFFTFKSV